VGESIDVALGIRVGVRVGKTVGVRVDVTVGVDVTVSVTVGSDVDVAVNSRESVSEGKVSLVEIVVFGFNPMKSSVSRMSTSIIAANNEAVIRGRFLLFLSSTGRSINSLPATQVAICLDKNFNLTGGGCVTLSTQMCAGF
jgi:hypothetical protein